MSEPSRSTISTSSYVEEMVPSFKTVMRNNSLRRQLELYLVQQGESQVVQSFKKSKVKWRLTTQPFICLFLGWSVEILACHSGIT